MYKMSIIHALCVLSLINSTYLEAMEYHFTHSATQDAQLLKAICNGPDPDDHPFQRAGFLAQSEDDTYGTHLVVQELDPLSSSMADFARTSLQPHGELKIKDSHIKVRTVLDHLKDKGRIALICVHGTYSKDIGFGDNLEKKSTHSIIDFAKKLGLSYDRAVSIISFVWSGDLDLEARKKAGAQLGAYLLEKSKYDRLITIGHSHGCNVINWAAYHMLEQGSTTQIDTAIHLASPVPDLQMSAPDMLGEISPEAIFNIKKLFHFYGSNDCTGIMGSLLAGWHTGHAKHGPVQIRSAHRITFVRNLMVAHWIT